MISREQRLEWERVGLCTNCGGLKLNPTYNWCEKCRAMERAKRNKKALADFQPTRPARTKEKPAVSETHKCWGCEWGKFLGDRFFCPFPYGVCMKDEANKKNEGNTEGKHED